MKRVFKLLPLAAVMFMGILSCDKENGEQSGSQIVTLGADKESFMVATLSGRVSGLDGVALDFECGIEYSTDESFSDEFSTRQKVDKKYTTDSYSITVYGIKPGKKYYYRAYYINQLLLYYGNVKTFTFDWTAPAVTTISAELTEFGTVVLKGLVKGKGTLVNDLSVYYPYGYYYGIEYSTTDNFEDNSTTILYPDRGSDSMENDSVICVLSQFKYSTTYYYRTFFRLGEISNYGEVKSFKKERDVNGYEYVDLGLSVLWATHNVGAEKPEDYGNYYAWGETESKTDYNWSTYKYCNGSNDSQNKYNTSSIYGTVDNKTILELVDDVAHVKWGGDWRMPTQSELAEINNSDNCTWTWTTQNGINGYLVESKKSGFEGTSIFLPAAGYRDDTSLYYVGSYSLYWSSLLSTDRPYSAWYLSLYQGSHTTGIGRNRNSGFTVRPVCP